MSARTFDDGERTFDFAAGLVEDNLLLVDRETGSVWSQLASRAVSGPMEGVPLRTIPSIQTTWGFWKEMHPDTRVMTIPGEEGRPYIYRDRTGPPPETPPEAHDVSTLGLGLVLAGDAWFFPLAELDRTEPPVRLEVGGQAVTVRYSRSGLTAWAEDAGGEVLPAILAYEEGWRSFFPESRTFRADRDGF